jgi:general secretion pathway protein F
MQYKVLAIRHDASSAVLVIEAPDAGTARRLASATGVSVVEVSSAASRFALWTQGKRNGVRRSGSFDVDLFCQELLSLLTAGVTVGEALETLAQKESQPATRQVLD